MVHAVSAHNNLYSFVAEASISHTDIIIITIIIQCFQTANLFEFLT
jgi:hypothetical protein